MELIGRDEAIASFEHHLSLTESKLITVYGRRRVGKTFLIRKFFANKLVFEVAGLYKGKTREQIKHFCQMLAQAGYTPAAFANPKDWQETFVLLEAYLDTLKTKSKKVIFIDEMPWFDTPRSGFLTMFEKFWNQYCTKRNDLIVIICGSAASWIIKKILQNKGGLHNRVSEKIKLLPFTLYETEKFLKLKGIVWNQYAITQLYMCTGGIPFYLDAVRKGESVVQFINRTFYAPEGFLRLEYKELYASLFAESEQHQNIIEILANNPNGLGREVIVENSKLTSGGTLTNVLDELEQSGFISATTIETDKKGKKWYRLDDFYSMFYLRYVAPKRKGGDNQWQSFYTSPSWAVWSGLAFERICFHHIQQIKKALQLTSIQTRVFSWNIQNEERGAQIDMLIERADNVTNIVEMKFAKDEFTIKKEDAKQLRNKIVRYGEWAPKRILMLTMVSSYGIAQNEHYLDLVQNQIRLKQLFAK